MTKQQAYDWVRNTFDDDNPDDENLRATFVAVFEREPDEDEEVDMWSHLASATPDLCGCSTRSEHNSVEIGDDTITETYRVEGEFSNESLRKLAIEVCSGYDFNPDYTDDEFAEMTLRPHCAAREEKFSFNFRIYPSGEMEWNTK